MTDSARPWIRRLRDLSINSKLSGMVAMFLLSVTGVVTIVALAFVISSGVRGYVSAESLWSKGQKDAVYAITRYLHEPSTATWREFQRAIAIPLGYRRARVEMLKPDFDETIAYQGFMAGQTEAADIPELIFLFRNFRSVDFLANAVQIWTDADVLVAELLAVSREIEVASVTAQLDDSRKRSFLAQIETINARVTPLEQAFSHVLAEGARQVQRTLLGLILIATGALLALSLLVAWAVSLDLRESIEVLRQGTQRVAEGDLVSRIAVRSGDELGVLAPELNSMIARRREAEVSLKAATEFREKIMENATNAIYTMDRNGCFATANRRTCDITGYPIEELIGLPWASMVSDSTHLQHLFVRFTDTIEGREPLSNYEVPLRRKDGSVVLITFSIAPLSRDGEVFGVVGAAEDITARKRNEVELQSRAAELARSNEELEQFAYVASHDLQEPLRTVSGFAQLLSKRYTGQIGPEADEYIGYVTSGVQRMKSLIEDLLAYSRVSREANAGAVIDLNRAAQTALANVHGAMTAAGAEVRLGPLPMVRANERQMVQLFQNLIGNAVKFRTDDPPLVEIGAEPQGDHWLITVRDNGIGIDPKHAEQVFGLFQRLHGRDKYAGNGIGLTICKKIVDLHHGRIWVEPGEPGTRFRFTLPMLAT